jgi:hypothetical protein
MRKIGWLLGIAALVGIFGIATAGARPSPMEAAPSTSISNISVNPNCGPSGGFSGTVTLSGSSTGTVQLGLFYHVPGNSTFTDSGLRASATFSSSSTVAYGFTTFSFPAANTYRIQVIDAAGLRGATTKSNSVQLCTPASTPAPCGSSSAIVPTTTNPSTGPFLGPLGKSTTLPTTSGTTQDYLNSCSPNGSKITTTAAEALSKICAYVGPVDSASQNLFSVAIYGDANGTPGSVLANSAVGTLTADSWNCLPVSASLTASTTYWLMFWSNSALGSTASGHGPTGSFVCPDNASTGALDNLCYTNGPANSGVFWNPAALTTFPSWTNPLSAEGSWVLGPWQFSIAGIVSP